MLERLRDDVPGPDRARLREVLSTSHGDPRRLTDRDKDDLRRILTNVDLRRLGRDAVVANVPLPFAGRWLAKRL